MRLIWALVGLVLFAAVVQAQSRSAGSSGHDVIYAWTYAHHESTEMENIGTTPTTITAFEGSTASAGMAWDGGNDILTVTYAGVYKADLSMAFTGTPTSTFECYIFKNTSTQIEEGEFSRKIGAANDIGAASFASILTLAAGDTIEIKCKGDSAGDDMTPHDAQFVVMLIAGA